MAVTTRYPTRFLLSLLIQHLNLGHNSAVEEAAAQACILTDCSVLFSTSGLLDSVPLKLPSGMHRTATQLAVTQFIVARLGPFKSPGSYPAPSQLPQAKVADLDSLLQTVLWTHREVLEIAAHLAEHLHRHFLASRYARPRYLTFRGSCCF